VSGRTSLCSGCGKRSAFSSLLEPRFVVADDTRERSLRDCWLAWARATVDFGGLSVLNFVVFVLIVGEELGWRGYALPRLLAQRSALAASLILGVMWGAWHLPTFFVTGAPQYGLPFSAFVLLTMAYSVAIGWVYVHARGSVLIASLMHGAINLSQGFFLGGVDPASEYWLLAAVYGVAALAFGANPSRKRYVEANRPQVQDKASSG
jgi:membrane protease YdiL (CAAX protease family)